MTQQVHLVAVRNPFDRRERETRLLTLESRITLLEIVREQLPGTMPVTVSLNGRTLTEVELAVTLPVAGDQIVVIPTVHGGESGKMILRVVITIVATIVGAMAGQYYLGPTTWAALSAGTAAAIGAGIGATVGGLIANAVLPPPSVSMPRMESIENSQAYAWNPQTTQTQGAVVPRFYGKFRLYGNIVSCYLESDGSRNYLNALISLGMGPYRRLYDFRINDQPIENFQGVEIHTRLGQLDQPVIPNFNDTKTEYPQAVKIVNGAPHIHLTTGSAFDALEVDITFPQGLWYANDSGGLDPHTVDVRVEIKKQGDVAWTVITHQAIDFIIPASMRWSLGWTFRSSNGIYYWHEYAAGDANRYSHYQGEPGVEGYWNWITVSERIVSQTVDYNRITDNSTKAIRRTVRADKLTHGRYDIRITNLTADQTSTRFGDDLYFTSVREVLYDDFEYPRQVLVGIRALATDQLSGSLRFSCMGETALVRTYDGASWSVDNSSNPAWVMWDILTQPVLDTTLNVVRYDGMDPARLDHEKWLELAQYCDDLVPDGNGGQEKRIEFHGGFDSEFTLWDAVIQVGHTARAVPIWNGVHLTLAIDKPGTAVQLFSVGNIEQDSFDETFLPMADRASEIEVDFINSANEYQRDRLSVIDPANLKKTNKTTLQMMGCVTVSQAWRAGQYRLRSNACLLRAVKWNADVDAIACTVGDIVRLQHDVPQWGEGGRIVAATSSTVTLDKSVTLEAGKSYAIMVRRSDDAVIEHVIADPPGTYETLNLTTPFTTIPASFDVYAVGESNKIVKLLRLVGIEPDSDPLKRVLTGIDYNESIFGGDTEEPMIPTENISSINVMPLVSDLVLTERLQQSPDGTLNEMLDIRWRNPLSTSFAKVEIWYTNGGSWICAGETTNDSFTLPVFELKTYTIAVRSVNTMGQSVSLQGSLKASITIAGKTLLPGNVTGFSAELIKGQIRLTWNPNQDKDLSGYEIQEGDAWGGVGNTILVTNLAGTSFTWPLAAAGDFTFLIKAIDTSGLYSETAARSTCVFNEPAAIVHIYMSENLYTTNVPSVVKSSARFTWDEVDNDIIYYEVEKWALTDDTWIPLGQVALPAYTVEDTKPGTLQFRVRGVNVGGLRGPYTPTTVMLAGKTAPPDPPTAVAAVIVDNLVKITITPSGDLDLASHSIRVGDSWLAGTEMGTISHPQNVILWQPTSSGNLQFWVKSTDTSNIESLTATGSPIITVSPPNFQPGGVISPQVIDNNVLLKWPEASGTYPVDVYEVRKGLDFATAQVVGQIRGTFTAIFETAAGTYKYWVAAIDTAGLYSSTPLSIYSTVNQPPDFVLRDQRSLTWAAGTKTNCVVDVDGSLIGPVSTSESFESHFTSRGWATPQAQIDAGYPVFAQPGVPTGQYVETVDYGTVIPSSKITLDITRTSPGGTVTIAPKISVSSDGVSWTDFTGVYFVYATNFRYVKVTLDFATSNGGVMSITNSLLRLDLKKKNISMAVNLPSTTGDGDQINFADYGASFIDIEAIVPGAPWLNNSSLDPCRVIINFIDAANPTFFKALAYDKSGNRIALTGANKASFIITGV